MSSSSSAAATYKLSYFPIPFPGRGLADRLAFAVAGIPYEDEAVPWADWPVLKSTLPYHQLPILATERGTLLQTNAILRLLGKRAGFYPADDWEAALADEICDAVESFLSKMFADPPTPATPEEHKRLLTAEIVPGLLTDLEKRLVTIGGAPGRAVGSSLSTADIRLYQLDTLLASGITGLPADIAASESLYPRLRAINKTVGQHPAVAAYSKKATAAA